MPGISYLRHRLLVVTIEHNRIARFHLLRDALLDHKVDVSYFADFFCAAHRLRCAAEIRSRASGLITRFRLTDVVETDFLPRRPVPEPVSKVRAC
jgi:hypothetical protein